MALMAGAKARIQFKIFCESLKMKGIGSKSVLIVRLGERSLIMERWTKDGFLEVTVESTKPQSYAEELIINLGMLEATLRDQEGGERFCRILRAALEDLPEEVLNKFHKNKKRLRCLLSLFPDRDEEDSECISLGSVEFDQKTNDIRMVFDYGSINRLSDEAIRGLIGRLIAVASLGRCTDEEVDKRAIRWGFKEGLEALGKELSRLVRKGNQ